MPGRGARQPLIVLPLHTLPSPVCGKVCARGLGESVRAGADRGAAAGFAVPPGPALALGSSGMPGRGARQPLIVLPLHTLPSPVCGKVCARGLGESVRAGADRGAAAGFAVDGCRAAGLKDEAIQQLQHAYVKSLRRLAYGGLRHIPARFGSGGEAGEGGECGQCAQAWAAGRGAQPARAVGARWGLWRRHPPTPHTIVTQRGGRKGEQVAQPACQPGEGGECGHRVAGRRAQLARAVGGRWGLWRHQPHTPHTRYPTGEGGRGAGSTTSRGGENVGGEWGAGRRAGGCGAPNCAALRASPAFIARQNAPGVRPSVFNAARERKFGGWRLGVACVLQGAGGASGTSQGCVGSVLRLEK